MNRTDRKILEILQKNSQVSNQDLAEEVALSPSPCLRRVKRLEEEGYIEKYVALLNPEKLDLQLTVLVAVGLKNHDSKKMRDFEKSVEAMPEVMQCYLITGQTADYMLKVVVPNLQLYQIFLLNKLTTLEVVDNVHSSFILRNIIDRTALPLDHLK